MAYPIYQQPNNYGYTNPYAQYSPAYQMQGYQNYAQQQYQPVQTGTTLQQPAQQPQGLPGKIVESLDVVKTIEIPLGGSALFPQADMSAIHLKAWNNDGSTRIVTYRPEIVDDEEPIDTTIISSLNSIYESLEKLEKKIDGMKSGTSAPIPMKRKEVSKNE